MADRNWQYDALDKVVELAVARRMPVVEGPLGLRHVITMPHRLAPAQPIDKVGRWLGWAQAAVTGSEVSTLDEMMDLNRTLAPPFATTVELKAIALYSHLALSGALGPRPASWSDLSDQDRDSWRSAVSSLLCS